MLRAEGFIASVTRLQNREIAHALDGVKSVDYVRKNELAVGGQCNATRRSLEDALSKAGLEPCDTMGQCRLTDITSRSCREKRTFFNERLDIPQLLEIHGMT